MWQVILPFIFDYLTYIIVSSVLQSPKSEINYCENEMLAGTSILKMIVIKVFWSIFYQLNTQARWRDHNC